MPRPFSQVDVFTNTPYRGNPVAVVHDAEGITTEQMQRFAHWMNLSETTFVLEPTDSAADYRVRIFTPAHELPFAGHPTLGTCHAWLESGGVTDASETVVQQCEAGLVSIRRSDAGLAFQAPPLTRSGPLDSETRSRVVTMLDIDDSDIVDAEWAVNGPDWVAVLFATTEEVLALEPRYDDLSVGAVAPCPEGSTEAFEVRAFFPKDGAMAEDPVTGSLNASLAQWLVSTDRARAPYVARQGTALGRSGRVHVHQDSDDAIWVGGGTVTCVVGEVEI